MSKFLKVVDSPVISSAVPVVLGDGPRMFSYADSSNNVVTVNATPKLVWRVIIPCDNSLGTSVMTIHVSGHFSYIWGVQNNSEYALFNTWTVMKTAANATSAITYSDDVVEKSGTSGADAYVPSGTQGFFEQTLFLKSFTIQPGVIEDHYLDFCAVDKWSLTMGLSSVALTPVTFWMQGYVST